MNSKKVNDLCVNSLRCLAVDMVEAANSGHPGLPLGAAPMAYLLWDRFLRHNPKNPNWFNRDRFVLSAGHGSALLYALLHVMGYELPLAEIKKFRQWGSRTPGHPEFGVTVGVETTTGPLGQGFTNGVGMAMAERFLADKFNRDDYPIVDHYTYAIVSDGDLMEGVSSEAASLAGTWKLGKIIYLYDDNHITIDGGTHLSFTEDVGKRFEAYGWHVQRIPDGNDLGAIEKAIRIARKQTNKPSLIMVRTHIGFGSPKQDSASAHGEPLGPEAIKKTKKSLGWPLDKDFYIPEEALIRFRQAVDRGAEEEAKWQKLMERYRREHPDLSLKFEKAIKGALPEDWDDNLPVFNLEDGPLATRSASGKVLNVLAEKMDNLVGGSADLAPSNKTMQLGKSVFGIDDTWGPNVHFGVREHAMAAITNGLALHGGIFPYTGTFLVFSDYMRPALRLAAMMQTRSIFIFTHDSICVGEDGPTHQPVEQLMSLRTIPGLTVIRPADANETTEAWRLALTLPGPVALILTRQKLPVIDRERYPLEGGVTRGAYLLSESDPTGVDIFLVVTGSEVHLALDAQIELKNIGIKASVVSMPSWELFEKQPEEYKRSILPPDVPKLAIEVGSTLGWYKYVGSSGDVIGIDRFGVSAPGETICEKFGFSVAEVVSRATRLLNK